MQGQDSYLSSGAAAQIVSALCIALLALTLILNGGGEAVQVATPTSTPVPTPQVLTKAQFIQRADEICAALNVMEPDPSAATFDQAADEMARFRDKVVGAIDELLALQPPAADRAFLDKEFLALVRDARKIFVSLFDRVEAALRAGDLVALNQIDQAVNDDSPWGPTEPAATTATLRSYGFDDCAEEDDAAYQSTASAVYIPPAPVPGPSLTPQFLRPMPRVPSASTHAPPPPTPEPTPEPFPPVPVPG